MPPKKRKATSASSTPAKKLRIGQTSSIPDPTPDISSTGRPKRTSVSEPQYRFSRPRRSSTTTQTATPNSAVATSDDQVRKRGRPAKNVTTTTASNQATPKKQAPKKVKSEVSSAPPAVLIPARKGRPAPKQSVLNDVAPRPTKRGRMPRALKQIEHTSSESEAAVKVAGAAGSTTKAEDKETLDHDIQYWLMKAEPESRMEKGHDVKFSIDDLEAKSEPEGWDGVRNPVARNNMRAMRKGDLAFFYHSNCPKPGVVGVMRIVAEHSVDESAFDPDHPYYDPKSDREKPKWELVHVEFVKKFANLIGLKELRSFSLSGGMLEHMQTLKQSRLSVSSVTPDEWRFILGLAGEVNSLGHGSANDGYESDIDGEGQETGGDMDGDGGNGLSGNAVGLGLTFAHDVKPGLANGHGNADNSDDAGLPI